jgi:hypothetical protein
MRAVLAAAVLLTACDHPRTVYVENPYAPADLKLSYNGRVVATISDAEDPFVIHTRAWTSTLQVEEGIGATLETPCGPRTLLKGPNLGVVLRDGDGFKLTGLGPPKWTLWIDNRGQPQTTVGLNTMKFIAPAGAVLQRPVLTESCATMYLEIDGRHIGTVSPGGAGVLVDTGGQRCYDARRVVYDSLGSVFFGAAPKAPAGELLSPAYLHPMPMRIEYLLKDPDPMRKGIVGMPQAPLAVRDADCDGGFVEPPPIAVPGGHGVRDLTDFVEALLDAGVRAPP